MIITKDNISFYKRYPVYKLGVLDGKWNKSLSMKMRRIFLGAFEFLGEIELSDGMELTYNDAIIIIDGFVRSKLSSGNSAEQILANAMSKYEPINIIKHTTMYDGVRFSLQYKTPKGKSFTINTDKFIPDSSLFDEDVFDEMKKVKRIQIY